MKWKRRNKIKKWIIAIIGGLTIIIVIAVLWEIRNIGWPITTKVHNGKIQVIDVSFYNGTINWKKVKDQQINHAMLKIGSGIDRNHRGSEDKKFAVNARNAKYASIYRGVYYYSYAKNIDDAKKEAQHCISILKKHQIKPSDLDLPVALDIEEKSVFQTGRKNVTAITVTFCKKIKKAGYTPMIYSQAYALRNYFDYSKIKSYKIWVAHYTEAIIPAIPFSYQMWQYTCKASIPGANTKSGHCDVSYYRVKY